MRVQHLAAEMLKKIYDGSFKFDSSCTDIPLEDYIMSDLSTELWSKKFKGNLKYLFPLADMKLSNAVGYRRMSGNGSYVTKRGGNCNYFRDSEFTNCINNHFPSYTLNMILCINNGFDSELLQIDRYGSTAVNQIKKYCELAFADRCKIMLENMVLEGASWWEKSP